MSLPKVQCPICSGNYSKLGINAHVNSCLNALDLSEDDGDTTEPSCQDVRSPPHKLAKLDDGSKNSISRRTDNVMLPHKPQKDSVLSRDSYAVTTTTNNGQRSAAAELQSSPTATVTASDGAARNAFSMMTWNRTGRSAAKASPHNRSGLSPKSSNNNQPSSSPKSFQSNRPSQSPVVSPKSSVSSMIYPVSAKSDANLSCSPLRGVNSDRSDVSPNAKSNQFKNNSGTSAGTTTLLASSLSNARVQDTNNNRPTEKKVSSSRSKNAHQPLAERMRPLSVEDYVGQEHLMGRGKMLRQLLMSHSVPSMIIWGPPGCGKTTLARIIAARCKETHDTRFVPLSATTSGIADVKEVIKIAKNDLRMMKRKTILFVDEIHRFNKLQQDSFLPHVEDGTIILIGATTENPSFQVNNALMSRCKVLVLEKLTVAHIEKILHRAVTELGAQVTEHGQSPMDDDPSEAALSVDKAAVSFLAHHCDGDARTALNTLQTTVETKRFRQAGGDRTDDKGSRDVVSVDDMKEGLQRSHVQYDRTGEEHYNCASALQKSIRGSDDSAALYWMTRMLEGGEDPMFIARRLVVCASEDIGLADPTALPLAVACQQACHLIGKPECAINLAHCVTYLARSPKSNESYAALSRARRSIRDHEGPLPGVPLHLRNAPTKLMKNLGYGAGYKYSHNYPGSEQQNYLPEELKGTNFFADDD